MSAKKPVIYLIGGCNGAGKTTFAREFLPKEVKCLRFLNADEIARGLSPFAPGAASVQAARILLGEIRASLARKETFALESTLSGRTYASILKRAKKSGYQIRLHYLFLPNPNLAIARVKERVSKGGHHVPSADVRRRYHRSLRNFLSHYAPLSNQWALWNSETTPPALMGESESCSYAQLASKLTKR